MQSRIIESFIETIKMNILFNMKSGSGYYEMMIPILVILFFSYFFSNDNNNNNNTIYNTISSYIFDLDKIYYNWLGFKQKNTIIIEGKRCIKAGEYATRTDNLFSDRFQAIWYYISNNHSKNNTIYSIKELAHYANDDIYRSRYREENMKNQKTDIFVVDQFKWFKLDKDIYCKVYFNKESIESGTKKIVNNIETINIEIFSYKKLLKELIEYIDNLTTNYVTQIQNVRINKKFIYTYLGTPKEKNECDDKYSYWEECEFKSFRTFDNLFFDSKQKLLDKINFYKNNEDWYKKEGHPYTFGIGLTGPPGTGKTSIIKCIANMLNRHLIVIPLNKIKTQREFSECFFEKRYNRNNEQDSIVFSNKIIVFEDIDCMTDIVKQRKEKISLQLSDDSDMENTEENTEEDIKSSIEGDIERNTEENKKRTSIN